MNKVHFLQITLRNYSVELKEKKKKEERNRDVILVA